MADITLAVSNTNLLTLTNNELTQITYSIERMVCKGNTLSYSAINSDNSNLPSGIILTTDNITYQFIEDGLYKMTIETDIEEDYFIRVTGNIEACQRALFQDIACNKDDCDKYTYLKKYDKYMTFMGYKTYLFSLLNTYQQEQSIDSLVSIPEAERLTVCQYFCILKDFCGNCINIKSYNTVVTDCGCSK